MLQPLIMTAKKARLLFLLVGWVMGACSFQPSTPSRQVPPANPHHALVDFPLAKGTTWVYSYLAYEPTTTNPTQIVTATYLFTETVIDTQTLLPYFVAHVQREERLVKAEPGWTYPKSSRPDELWYVVRGQQVYESFQPLDLSRVQTDSLFLAYDFPLATGRSWCPRTDIEGEQVQDCVAAGKRVVVSQEGYETPAGKFPQCYKITEDVNSGGVTRWFCHGVGVVAQRYDHAGTRFGFQQVLVSHSEGSP